MNIRLEKHLGYMWSRGSQGRVCDHPDPQQEFPDEAQHARPPPPGVERQGFAAEEQVLCLAQLCACLGSAPLLLGCGFVLAVSPSWPSPVPSAEEVLRKVTHSFSIYILNDDSVPETRCTWWEYAVSQTKYFLDLTYWWRKPEKKKMITYR